MTEEEDRPGCYGTFEDDHPDCTPKKCDWVDRCKRLTGRKNSKTAGLSRARAMKAMCYECQGGTNRGPDCNAPACPLYPWMSKAEEEPRLWWMGKTKTWNEGCQRARGATVIVGHEEDDEYEDEDEDDAEE